MKYLLSLFLLVSYTFGNTLTLSVVDLDEIKSSSENNVTHTIPIVTYIILD